MGHWRKRQMEILGLWWDSQAGDNEPQSHKPILEEKEQLSTFNIFKVT